MSGKDDFRRPLIITTGAMNNRLKPPVVNRPTPDLLAAPTPMSNNSNRLKVILQPGHSALDWESLKRSSNFRGDLPSYPVKVPKDELRKHCTIDDYWIVLNRKVYNLTPYLLFHPGGVDILKQCAGKDGTALFNKYHPWVNLDRMLDLCFIGILV